MHIEDDVEEEAEKTEALETNVEEDLPQDDTQKVL